MISVDNKSTQFSSQYRLYHTQSRLFGVNTTLNLKPRYLSVASALHTMAYVSILWLVRKFSLQPLDVKESLYNWPITGQFWFQSDRLHNLCIRNMFISHLIVSVMRLAAKKSSCWGNKLRTVRWEPNYEGDSDAEGMSSAKKSESDRLLADEEEEYAWFSQLC